MVTGVPKFEKVICTDELVTELEPPPSDTVSWRSSPLPSKYTFSFGGPSAWAALRSLLRFARREPQGLGLLLLPLLQLGRARR